MVAIYNSGCDALKALALALLQQIVTLNPISATDAAKNLPGIVAAATLATKEGIMNTNIDHLLVCSQLVLNDTHNRIKTDHKTMKNRCKKMEMEGNDMSSARERLEGFVKEANLFINDYDVWMDDRLYNLAATVYSEAERVKAVRAKMRSKGRELGLLDR